MIFEMIFDLELSKGYVLICLKGVRIYFVVFKILVFDLFIIISWKYVRMLSIYCEICLIFIYVFLIFVFGLEKSEEISMYY